MTHRDPTIIAYCHPRDAAWLNAALNASSREQMARAAALHEIARALETLSHDSVDQDDGTSSFARLDPGVLPFAGVNRSDVPLSPWASVSTTGKIPAP